MTSRKFGSALLTSALALTLTACSGGGGNSDDSPDATSAAPAPSGGGADFCEQLADARETFNLMDVSLASDWSAFSGAAEQLAAVEPPAEIATPWQVTTEFYAYIADLFEGVDFSDREAVGDAMQSNLGPETETRAKKAENAVAEVEEYAKSNCERADEAASAPVSDACELVTDGELARSFPTGVPEPDSRTYGPDTMECIWESDAAQVSIMVAPLEEFTRTYLDKSTPMPTGEIDGLEGGNTFKGTLGVGRFSTKGHSVSFTHEEVGGFVSVRHGDADSRAADVGTAAQLAKALVGRL